MRNKKPKKCIKITTERTHSVQRTAYYSVVTILLLLLFAQQISFILYRSLSRIWIDDDGEQTTLNTLNNNWWTWYTLALSIVLFVLTLFIWCRLTSSRCKCWEITHFFFSVVWHEHYLDFSAAICYRFLLAVDCRIHFKLTKINWC